MPDARAPTGPNQPVSRGARVNLLFEPAGTLNTGNVVGERTVANPERLT
jgi:hypothetical protein